METEEEPAAASCPDQGDGTEDQAKDRRNRLRLTVDEDFSLMLVGHGLPLQGRILDLSQEGCRLSTRERFTAGAKMQVEMAFSVNGVAFRIRGLVQWTDSEHLMGIRFLELTPRRREQLAEVISDLDAAAAAEKQRQVKLKAEKEAERLAREQALAKVHPSAQPFEAGLTLDELSLPPLEPIDQQRSVHLTRELSSTAAIFLIKTGSRLTGRLRDLSLNGCRILTDEKLPVGIYTLVEPEFTFDGGLTRLSGVVQAIHDGHDVEIRFLELTERKRKQVELLIGEIEQFEQLAAHPAQPDQQAADSAG